MNFQYIQILFIYLLLICKRIYNSKFLPCDEKDKKVLLMFKYGVIDPFGVLSSWSAKQNCCQWPGMLCENTTGKVTGLNLTCPRIYPVYGNDNKLHCLSGELNVSYFSLKLGNNDFSIIHYHGQGENSSNNLHHLDLSYNDNLKADHMLHWISNLSSLQYLDLTGINLQEKTNWLQLVTLLPSLSQLYLRHCGLWDIYPSLQYANFTALEVLDLSNNDFFPDKLPNWIFNFSCRIAALILSENSLQGQLPRTFPHFQSLESLLLDQNALSGSIPNWVGQLEKLNKLDSLPLLNILNSRIPLEPSEKFWKFISNQVGNLVMYNSSINGSISNVLFNSKVLMLNSNNFRGNVPRISPNVTLLDLSNNSLSGSISHFLCGQTKEKNNLKYLDLSHNVLSGEIPNCWIHWKSLEYINLEGNNFRGQIPYSISNLSNLVSFSLFNNRLSGEVPVSLKNCKKLRILNLGENKFSGAISNWVGQNIIAF
ncbi:hypothetical protein Ahy_B07g087559 [Arachis hypogaea]|uniref:Leucine-rich repeat-containing N-terminal plant-type domain-containing protein n=1 Tax=Arachis hypogaea TaxID=3818 RepID=A0A444YCG6_ARAHY|nr:hypothetical protein Ahy_B07g087559 [Arachis hypogaea]